MQVDVKKVNSYSDECALLRVVEVTENIQSAIDALENNCRVIAARCEGETVMCQIDKIYYIASIQRIIVLRFNTVCMNSRIC